MYPVGELGDSYETAFYAVSEAYIESAKSVADCNARKRTALEQMDKIRGVYDNKE